MNTTVQQGYILLADISGFDAYLAGVELEHAQGVIQELLELIVGCLRPPMHLASLEGDAVLTYAPPDRLPRGETLLELTEATYVAFRDRLNSIHRNNTCNCQACRNVPSLDLKFLVHYGEYVIQSTNDGGVELGGLDANLVRQRLLKDQISQSNGSQAYALFTGPGLEQMHIWPEDMQTNSASYEHLGEIQTARLDLQPRYQALTAARQAFVTPEEADIVLTRVFPVAPSILWGWLNDPDRRTRWMRWRTWSAGLRPGGRTGIGASNHCAHGVGTIIETVLDWRPYDYFTVETAQTSIHLSMTQTYRLESLESGAETRLHMHTRLQKPAPKWLTRLMLRLIAIPLWKSDLERLAQLVAGNSTDNR
jgi:hypothetical protein